MDLEALGEKQIRIDCDVLQADGGTRTASITGAYVAMAEAVKRLYKAGLVHNFPVRDSVAAISCGIYEGKPVLDLDYEEDSCADTDANFVITGKGGLIEIQATAEKEPFSEELFTELLTLARKGCSELKEMQEKIIEQA
jgi:ribonuclease PH